MQKLGKTIFLYYFNIQVSLLVDFCFKWMTLQAVLYFYLCLSDVTMNVVFAKVSYKLLSYAYFKRDFKRSFLLFSVRAFKGKIDNKNT